MNRFENKFIEKLAQFSKEYGFVITDDGYIEPISDWVDPDRPFKYEVQENENGIKLSGFNQS